MSEGVETRWFYFDGVGVQGPVSEQEILDLKSAGVVSADTQLCREGSETWVTFSDAFSGTDGVAPFAAIRPPPLPFEALPEPKPTKRRKLVVASKLQIAGIVMLAIIGLLKLLAIKTDGATSQNPATVDRPSARNSGSLIAKIDDAREQFREYARLGMIGEAHGRSMNAEQQQKFLEEFTAVGISIQKSLGEISREAENFDCPAELKNRVSMLRGNAWMQNEQFAAYTVSTLHDLRSWVSRN